MKKLSHLASIAFVRSFGDHHSIPFLKHHLMNVMKSCVDGTDAVFGDCVECFKFSAYENFSYDIREIVKFNCSRIMTFLSKHGTEFDHRLFHETSSLSCLMLFEIGKIDQDDLDRSVETQLKSGNVACLKYLLKHHASLPLNAISIHLQYNRFAVDEMIHYLINQGMSFEIDVLFCVNAPVHIFELAMTIVRHNLSEPNFLIQAIDSSCDFDVIKYFAKHCNSFDQDIVLLAIDKNSSIECVSMLIDRCKLLVPEYWEHFLADESIDEDIGNLLWNMKCPFPSHVTFVCCSKKHWIYDLEL